MEISQISTDIPSSDSLDLESVVQYLLNNNDPPTDEEFSIVQDIISKTEILLQKAQATKNGLADYYTQLLQSYKSILSPWRRCPDDVLAEIFLQYKANLSYSWDPPWKLGHVCRRWRIFAISLSKLWCTLPHYHIGMPMSDARSSENKIGSLKTLLTRSSTAPLSVSLSESDSGVGTDSTLNGDADKILTLLLENSQRWEKLYLSVKSPRMYTQLNSRLNGHLPSLRALTLDVSCQKDTYVEMFNVETLRRLYLVGNTINGHCPRLPWAQITELELIANLVNADHLQRALLALSSKSAGRIERLSVTFETRSEDSQILYLPPAAFIHLRILVIKSPYRNLHAEETWQNLGLHKLTLPALEELTYGYSKNNPASLPGIAEMIRLSRCRLRKLVLDSLKPHGKEVCEILGLTPFLVELDLNDPEPELFDDLLQAVETGAESSWLLVPSLMSLTVHLSAEYTGYGHFRRFAGGRCDETERELSRLRFFRIVFTPSTLNPKCYYDIPLGQLTGILGDSTSPIILDIKNHIQEFEAARRQEDEDRMLCVLGGLVSYLENISLTSENIIELYTTKITAPVAWMVRYGEGLYFRTRRGRTSHRATLNALFERVLSVHRRWTVVFETILPQLVWGWDINDLLYLPRDEDSLRGRLLPPFGTHPDDFSTKGI